MLLAARQVHSSAHCWLGRQQMVLGSLCSVASGSQAAIKLTAEGGHTACAGCITTGIT